MRTLFIFALCFATSQLHGQDVRVQVGKQTPPYYAGRPAIIQFTVEGFDQEPTPTVEREPSSEALRGQMAGASPRVMSYMNNINGRVTRATVVTYTIQYRITADQPGDYLVGPFVIKQGTKEARVQAVPMSFESVPEDPDMRVRLILPEGNLHPDQRVPVRIEWWYAGDTENVQDWAVYSPLFDQFRFGPDPEPRRGDLRMPIDTKDGRMLLAAGARKEEHEGRAFVVVTATRTLIPDRIGTFQLSPITASLERVTSRVRQRSSFDDLGFGSSLLDEMMGDRRRPASTVLSRAVGIPQALVVKTFPLAGKPESFAGAVGEGFSIEVAANRTVVRVGDPIGLDITLRGKGNIENASLPPLSAEGGLNPDMFRLPEGDVPGRLADGTKGFHVSVRVSDESVTEIPALAYTWFDPETETYQTARSKPIALRVMPAQVISASDVVSGSARQTSQADTAAGNEPKAVAAGGPKDPVFSLSGADLAIEPSAGVALRDSRGWTRALPLQAAFYGAGLLLIVLALVERRRKDVDPAIVARRKNVRHQQERITRAARLSRKEAATEIAEAMRALVAELPDVARDEAQAVIAACESIVFAPTELGESQLDGALIEQAQTVAARFKHSAASDQL